MSTTAAVENRSSTLVIHPSEALEIDLGPLLKPMDNDEFFAFCGRNRELRIEMDKDGEITIMSPTDLSRFRRRTSLRIRQPA